MESSCFKSQRSGNSQEALVASLQFGGKPPGVVLNQRVKLKA